MPPFVVTVFRQLHQSAPISCQNLARLVQRQSGQTWGEHRHTVSLALARLVRRHLACRIGRAQYYVTPGGLDFLEDVDAQRTARLNIR
jgi:hypothetical protein